MGTQGPVHAWLTSVLHQRTQRVLVNREASDSYNVLSRLPESTVLGLMLFLIFINDIPSTFSSPCKPFANDLVVYMEIKTGCDSKMLQKVKNNLTTWEATWGMNFFWTNGDGHLHQEEEAPPNAHTTSTIIPSTKQNQ